MLCNLRSLAPQRFPFILLFGSVAAFFEVFFFFIYWFAFDSRVYSQVLLLWPTLTPLSKLFIRLFFSTRGVGAWKMTIQAVWVTILTSSLFSNVCVLFAVRKQYLAMP